MAVQRREWLDRLGWDLAEISKFIAELLRGGALRGLALLEGKAAVGYAFYAPEPSRCLIGDVYVVPTRRAAGAAYFLTAALLRQIRRSHPTKRVESQALHFDVGGVDEAFAEQGFAREGRAYMVADPAAAAPRAGHRRVLIRPWEDDDFGPTLEVVYQAYRGTVDAKTSVGYRTRDGCADLLDALTNGAWCGRFDPAMTQVAVDRETRRRCGVAIASRISKRTAHFGQISVLPIYQGEGVGRALVDAALAAVARARMAEASLAVTLANAPAVRLYERCGFRPRLEFPVYYLDPARVK